MTMCMDKRNQARLTDLIAASDGRLRDLGAEIKQQRILQGLTVHDLAQMIGVLDITLQRMERDCSKVRITTIERACRALGMTVTIGYKGNRDA